MVIVLLAGRRPVVTQAMGGSGLVYLPLVMKPEPLIECTTYIEQGGLLVFEVESIPPVEHWVEQTDLPGYTGDSYYTWHGPDYFSTPGVGILSYPILINTAGWYNFRLHNRHDWPDPSQQNDLFAQMDGAGWIKTFSSQRGVWTFRTAFDHHTYQGNAEYFLSAGPHTLELSARSAGFAIDRVVFYRQDGGVNGEDASLPVSPCQ